MKHKIRCTNCSQTIEFESDDRFDKNTKPFFSCPWCHVIGTAGDKELVLLISTNEERW